MVQQAKTGLETDLAAAFPTRISDQRTLEKALIEDLIDSVLNMAATAKTSAYTVVINAGDSGKAFEITTADVVFTLPSIAIGNVYTFINNGASAGVLLTLNPAAADGITYLGSETDNKDMILTKATSIKGDYAVIASFTAVVTWQVPAVRGIWAKE